VSRYSRIIAQVIGLGPKDIDRISTAALLHDVGKIHEIFAPILSKPGRLTPEERAIMELHPIKSAELVAKISDLQDIIPAVRHHHENWDGTGYPDRLEGRDIPLGSRIIMFADTIDAMTTDRPYRKALGEAEVRSELRKFRGMQFDPNICDALVASPTCARIYDQNDSGRVQSLTQIFELVRRRMKTPAVA
jgi:HD-GYP domain-containing protein (c-di-GMP phosphodiesterase class II)